MEDAILPARIGSRRARQIVVLAWANDTGACCKRIGRFSPARARLMDDPCALLLAMEVPRFLSCHQEATCSGETKLWIFELVSEFMR